MTAPPPLFLNLCGLAVHLDLPDPHLHALVVRRYRAFVEPPVAAPSVHLIYSRRSPDPVASPPQLAAAALTGNRLTVGPPDAPWAWLDRSGGVGEVAPHASLLALDVLLRAERTLRALGAGGLALHAAAVEVDGVAHVFAGPSGAGKSTVAERLEEQGATVLCDEFLVVEPDAQGRMLARGTPFWRGQPGSAPVAVVWKLGRGERSATPLGSPSAVLRQLVGNLALPVTGRALEHAALAAAGTLAGQTAGFELRYVPGQPTLDLLRQAAGTHPASRAAAHGTTAGGDTPRPHRGTDA